MNADTTPALDDILASHRTGRPVVMGILNVTPDSFSDGGRFLDPAQAIRRAEEMVAQGAGILDVGAESTRPGSQAVPPEEQIRRLREILPPICRLGACVSIDTVSAEVARFALQAGATIINDISAGGDPALLPLAADRGAAVVLMHMLGEPRTMQEHPQYRDVTAEVRQFLAERLDQAQSAGLPRARCIADPGLGFGKTVEHNLALLSAVPELCELGVPVLIGASRKRFIGAITGVAESAGRLAGSLAVACAAYLGGATIFRVHDVAPTVQALAILQRIRSASR